MFQLSFGEYEVRCQHAGLPDFLPSYAERAALYDRFDAPEPCDGVCFLAVTRRGEPWPFLVITQRYAPAGNGFYPGALIVPETHRLFIGAGRRLLGYDLTRPARLWEDEADCGFWSWSRYGETVLMMAELELAAWTSSGKKLWSRFTDPPWEYRVEGPTIVVTDCRGTERLDLLTGRTAAAGSM
jgi:hypothetical protein